MSKILVNTTFVIADSVNEQATERILRDLMPVVKGRQPLLTRILHKVEEGSTSYALQFRAADTTDATVTLDRMTSAIKQMIDALPQHSVLHFTTMMEILADE